MYILLIQNNSGGHWGDNTPAHLWVEIPIHYRDTKEDRESYATEATGAVDIKLCPESPEYDEPEVRKCGCCECCGFCRWTFGHSHWVTREDPGWFIAFFECEADRYRDMYLGTYSHGILPVNGGMAVSDGPSGLESIRSYLFDSLALFNPTYTELLEETKNRKTK